MLQIEPAAPDDWTTAFEFALAHVPADQRSARIKQCISMLEARLLDARGVQIARREGRIIGAQVCVPLEGAACMFWLPCETEAANELVRAGLAWCRAQGCKLAQALAKPEERARAAPLLDNGFRSITHMQQWGRDLLDLPRVDRSGWRLERYRPLLAAEFAATLERTYEGTLDCPELNGVRTMAEIVAGHRAQGKFSPDWWWLAYVGARPAGVLMLSEMVDGTTWELAYLGVVPEQRNHGLARSLLSRAMHELRDTPALHLVLAVDERNHPARRLYQSLGFVAIDTSEVFLYVF